MPLLSQPYSPNLANTRLPIQATHQLDTTLHNCLSGPLQTPPSQCLPVHSWTARTYHAIPVLCMTFPDCHCGTSQTQPIRSTTAKPHTSGPSPTTAYRSPPRLPYHPRLCSTVPTYPGHNSTAVHGLAIPRRTYTLLTCLYKPRTAQTRLSMPSHYCSTMPIQAIQRRTPTILPIPRLPCRTVPSRTPPCPNFPFQNCPSLPDRDHTRKADPLLPSPN